MPDESEYAYLVASKCQCVNGCEYCFERLRIAWAWRDVWVKDTLHISHNWTPAQIRKFVDLFGRPPIFDENPK